MKPIADLVQYVTPYAPGCPDPVINRALIDAIDKFCRLSWYYQRRVTPISIQSSDTVVGDFDSGRISGITVNGVAAYPIASAGTDKFYITTDTGIQPFEVLDVWADGIALSPVTLSTVSEIPGWDTKSGSLRYFTREHGAPARLFFTPPSTPTLEMTVVYTVTPDATDIPDELFTEFREVLVAGALGILLSQPDQPYTDNVSAAINNTMFNHGVSNARIRTNKGHTRADVQVRPRRWV